MKHILKLRKDGYSCVICGSEASYDFPESPEKCYCGKPWAEEVIDVRSSYCVTKVLTCPDGHAHYITFYPVLSDCPNGKVVEEMIHACNLLQRDFSFPAQTFTLESWQRFGEQVAELIPKALKVDALFPEGLQHLAERLAKIKE